MRLVKLGWLFCFNSALVVVLTHGQAGLGRVGPTAVIPAAPGGRQLVVAGADISSGAEVHTGGRSFPASVTAGPGHVLMDVRCVKVARTSAVCSTTKGTDSRHFYLSLPNGSVLSNLGIRPSVTRTASLSGIST